MILYIFFNYKFNYQKMFNKSLFNKEKEENDKLKELEEEDFEQINKEISKALSNMKKERQDNNSDEKINEAEAEKDLNNFDYDFFSENSNSFSNDNISDKSENSFKSANVEINRNNSLKINMMKTNFKINNNFSGITKDVSNSSKELNNSLKGKNNSFYSMENKMNNNIQSNNIKIKNINKPFHSSPYLINLSNCKMLENNYLNGSGFNNINNLNNSLNNNPNIQMNNMPIINNNINNNPNMQMNNNLSFINNNINIINPNLQLNNQSNINNNLNFVNTNNNNFNNNNNSLNNINIINVNNNINNNQYLINNNINNNNFFSCPSIIERGVPGLYNLDSLKNIINKDNILKSRDKRKTLIIRNIPNKYKITLLLNELNKNFEDKFDILYLPQDYINNSNLGFGFINFVNYMHLILFYDEFVGKKWNCFNSKKRCQLAYSKYQGKNELMKYIHTKLGISNLDNNNENIKKSFYFNNNRNNIAPIEIPKKFYTNFVSFYPFSLCHNKDDEVFVVDKYFNI